MPAALLCPLEKIGLETDSPFQVPVKEIDFGKWGGKMAKNGAEFSVPSNVYSLAGIIAAIKDVNPLQVLDAAKINFSTFFNEVCIFTYSFIKLLYTI